MEMLEKPLCEAAVINKADDTFTESTTLTTSSPTEGDIEEEEEVAFLDVEMLQEHGVACEDVKQLQKAGINTIKGVQMCTRRKLLTLKNFNDAKVAKIKDICSKLVQVNPSSCFLTALEVSDQRRMVFKLTTGSHNLNNILEGGIESMAITEVFGEARTGKTQIAHTLCVTAQVPGKDGYPGGKVVYIDTEHTFRPERIKPISDRFQLDPTAVLENILYARAYNSEHQYELLNSVCQKFHEEPGIFKLLIVDSIMSLFRVDFVGAGEMSERQTKLGLMMSKLQKISEEYNVAVFLTNQITTDLNFSLLNDLEVKPVGGNILAHSSTTRLALKKGKANLRIARVYDSPNLEECETEFVITNGGIADPKSED